MSEMLFSSDWYRVASIKPVLKSHVEIHRHEYRGLIWYVFADKISGRNHRFNAKAYQIVGLMDGKRSLDQIWNQVSDYLGDYTPTQDEVIRLLGQLHAADLLYSYQQSNADELFQRQEQQQTQKLKQKLNSPLVQKFPLWDPDQFLQRYLFVVKNFYNWPMALLLLLTILSGFFAAVMNWQTLTSQLSENAWSPYNLVMMAVLYPLIKVLHELGHAFSTKIEGGEVHEMGIMFLLFMPIPYVNVSSASTFRSKYKRMLVSGSGIIVELFLAALALHLWLSVEPGITKDISFNILLIGGISSLFFNGNPLLKYDGYYLLADAINIPNLYQRSQRYLLYLVQKYIFDIDNLYSPANTTGEAGWLLVYSISSFLYRIILLWVIILFVTEKYFVIGFVMAIWLVWMQLILPLIKAFRFVFFSPFIQHKRVRAVSSSLGIGALLTIFLVAVPLPSFTLSEGIVWLPEQAQIRAETDGFADQLLARSSQQVSENTAVMKISAPMLDSEVEILQGKITELKTRFRSEWTRNKVVAASLKEEIKALKSELLHARKKQESMLVKSKRDGILVVPNEEDLTGRYFRRGELIAYVLDQSLPSVRVVVPQDDMGLIQEHTENVAIRLVNQIDQVFPARVTRMTPEATNRLPSAALGTTGGGKIVVKADNPEQVIAKEKVFQIDLEVSGLIKRPPVGARVYVRFDHGHEPLAFQWYRRVRQAFLGHFNV